MVYKSKNILTLVTIGYIVGFKLLGNEFRKQAMILNYQIIFKANNGCECSKPIFPNTGVLLL